MAERTIDRISEVPEPILHHILSFLEVKDAIKTCVASKQLYHVWSTLPYLDLGLEFFPVLSDDKDEDNEGQGEDNEVEDEEDKAAGEEDKVDKEKLAKILRREQLFDFMNQKLTRHRMQGLTIQKFRLAWSRLDVELIKYLDQWIHYLVECNIKEFVLGINYYFKEYNLPSALLTAASLRALTLNTCRMPRGDISFSSLRKLSLVSVCIDDQFLKDIISTCRDLEDLNLDVCPGLSKTIHITGQSQHMKKIQFRPHFTDVLDEFVLEAQHLEKFYWAGGGTRSIKINIITSFQGNLKSLVLCGADITNKWFCDLISKLPRLEELILAQLSLKSIEISSSSLKRLNLCHVFDYKDNRSGEFKMNTPNLVYFKYTGDLSSVFLNSLAVKEVNLEIEEVKRKHTSEQEQVFSKLMQLLRKFDYSDAVTLDGNTCFKQLIFPVEEKLKSVAPLAHIKHLILRGRYGNIGTTPVEVLPELLQNLLWMAPGLDNLSLKGIYSEDKADDPISIDLFIKFTFEKLSTGSEDNCCDCIDYSGRCLKHSLTHLKYELKGAGADAEVDRCLRNYFIHNAKLFQDREIECLYSSP